MIEDKFIHKATLITHFAFVSESFACDAMARNHPLGSPALEGRSDGGMRIAIFIGRKTTSKDNKGLQSITELQAFEDEFLSSTHPQTNKSHSKEVVKNTSLMVRRGSPAGITKIAALEQ